jgi:hypothetical protein
LIYLFIALMPLLSLTTMFGSTDSDSWRYPTVARVSALTNLIIPLKKS